MRKRIALVSAIALILSIFLSVPAFAENGTVTGSDVNLRTGPGVEYAVVDCLPKGAVVTVNDRSNSKWYNVTYNGTTGYISANYVKVIEETVAVITDEDLGYIDTPAEEPVQVEQPVVQNPSGSGKNGTVNAMYVRFRSGPGSNYSILGEYSSGAKVTVSGEIDGWSAITVNGVSGYMFSRYITLDGTSATAEAPAEVTPAEETPAPVEQTPAEEIPVPAAQPEQAAAAEAEFNGFVCGDSVCFRTGPSTAYKIISAYDRGKPVTVTGDQGDWKAVIIDGTPGYMFGRYISDTDPTGAYQARNPVTPTPAQPQEQTQTPAAEVPVQTTGKEGYINGNSVRFRAGASTNSQILGEYNRGQALTITGSNNGWTACTINGVNGYVYSSYVAQGAYSTPAVTVNTGSGSSSFGRQVADFALGYLGSRYTWGGSDPSEGFDCSGFTYYVFKHFGIELNRVACDQARNGVHVDHEDIQPGDVLCFYSGGDYIGHVGIYIGDGKFIHSSTSTTGVIISELSGLYVSRNYEARRMG